jgi:hypothetical protein
MRKSPTKPVETVVTTSTEETVILAPDFFQPLTSSQLAALDYYRRGLNVFPIPRPDEYERRGIDGKPAYLLTPFYRSRLHLCGPECRRREIETGLRCIPTEAATFEQLFYRANIGCMTGRTSGNLLDIDCDSLEAFHKVKRELDSRNIPYWQFTTGRGAGFLMRIIEGEAANIPEGKCPIPDCQLWGNSQYVVLPPSVHRTGVLYEWEQEPRFCYPIGEPPPAVSITALAWLGAELQKQPGKAPEMYGLPAWTIGISEANRRRLASPPGPNSHQRNTNLTPVVYDLAALVKRGAAELRDVESLLFDYCDKCDYPRRKVQGMLESALKKSGLTTSREYREVIHQPENKPYQLAQLFADSYDWRQRGRTATTDRAVFLACIERARLESKYPTFRASVREVGELANVSKNTAAAALDRLCHTLATARGADAPPLLSKSYSDDQRVNANRYTFTETALTVPNWDIISTCKNSVPISHTQNTDGKQDVFNGKRAKQRVYEGMLTGDGWQISELARALKMHRETVSRAVAWLVLHGLAVFSQSEGLYYGEPKTADELERLSAALGPLGKADKRRRDNERTREIRANLALAEERRRWSARG